MDSGWAQQTVRAWALALQQLTRQMARRQVAWAWVPRPDLGLDSGRPLGWAQPQALARQTGPTQGWAASHPRGSAATGRAAKRQASPCHGPPCYGCTLCAAHVRHQCAQSSAAVLSTRGTDAVHGLQAAARPGLGISRPVSALELRTHPAQMRSSRRYSVFVLHIQFRPFTKLDAKCSQDIRQHLHTRIHVS